jgi:hypothetical protein
VSKGVAVFVGDLVTVLVGVTVGVRVEVDAAVLVGVAVAETTVTMMLFVLRPRSLL